ncbi:hypothetical protein PGT21_034410 [Puccinia graminis f. sp. tritici]|uniref:Uncharacterized protein n=1 Tax=Puccinia graminis f. sp. tritici TaxID=56615 RepID=A0A5B0PK79_PUCGR|nr:hypothetical protein PGT21_034410 [Puccinia graminis f. sp. tritici]
MDTFSRFSSVPSPKSRIRSQQNASNDTSTESRLCFCPLRIHLATRPMVYPSGQLWPRRIRALVAAVSSRIEDTTAVVLTIQPHYVLIDRYRYLCALVLSPHDASFTLETSLFTSPASYINFHSNLQYFLHIVSQAVLCHLAPAITMSSNNSNVPSSASSTPVEIPAPQGYQTISNPTPAKEISYVQDGYRIYPERGEWSPLFVPKAETSVVQNGIRYYPERGDWSPLFVPNAETPRAADIPVNPMTDPGVEPAGMAANAPVDSMADHDTDMEATVLDNTPDFSRPPPIKAFPAPIPLPYGMELIQTGTHFLPQKEKWQSLYDPAGKFDLSSIPDEVPVPRGFIDPHPFCNMPVCCDPVFQNPPPGLVLPAVNPLVAANLQSHAPGAHPASASSSASDASTYPPLSEFLHLDHQSVQGLLSKKNPPPEATCLYTEEDVMRIFEGIAPEFVWLCDDFPPNTLNEFDRRVMFFENMQWHFKCKKSTYLSTRNF